MAAHQFQTRRFVRSVALAVPLLTLPLVAGRFWPWDCTVLFTQINDPEPPPAAASSTEAYPGLQLTVGPAQINGTWAPRYTEKKEIRTWIQQTMEVQGVPEGWDLGFVKMRQS